MRTVFLIALALALAACKDKPPAKGFAVAGAAPAGSCESRGKAVDGTDVHQCTDVLDPAMLDVQEKLCDAGFARGKACPTTGRIGGCVEPNGTVRWTYQGDDLCEMGRKFKGGTAPAIGAPAVYRCANTKVCIEAPSVVDLTPVMKEDCEAAGGAFATGACPTASVVARCTLRTSGMDSVRSYYGPDVTAEGAKEDCDLAEGTLATP